MLSDKDIIVKIKNGEIDHYLHIVNKFTDSIYQYVKTKIKKKEDIEDIVQNVFISFYKAIDRFDENKPVKPYLYSIVGNELKMFYRKYKKILPLKEEIAQEEQEEKIFLEHHLENLSASEKDMLLMIAEGHSYEEIAEKFKKPINTVKSIIRRARIKVRSDYEKT